MGQQRLNLIDCTGVAAGVCIASRRQISQKQGIVGGQQPIQMTDAGFIVADKLEVIGGGQIHIDHGVFFVGDSSQIESAMEPNKDALIKPVRESARRKGYVIGPLAFGARERIRQGLKRDQRLNAAATDNLSGTVGGVIGGKTEIRDGSVAELRRRNPIQLISAERFVWVDQAVDAVVLEIQVACDRVEGEASGVTQALGQACQVGSNYVGDVIGEGQHINGLAFKRSVGARDLGAADRCRSSGLGKVLVRTKLEKQVTTSRVTGS